MSVIRLVRKGVGWQIAVIIRVPESLGEPIDPSAHQSLPLIVCEAKGNSTWTW
ncbi:MAG TPA: hypothetical protein VMU69_23230 [Bradyrhizobium sp.]|nr:hypothetical protein [Bradyrhizobium sp.]